MDQIAELKKMVLDLTAKVKSHEAILTSIKHIPLSTIAKNLDIKKQTLTYHIKNNYLENRDFYKQNGKIYISVGILQNIKAHYEK